MVLVDCKNAAEEYARKIHLVMDDEDDFTEFSHIVRSFKSKEILESNAIVKLTGILKHKIEDLTLGLNCYLSNGFEIVKSRDGQLFYRSPTQDDDVPLLVDIRMHQLMAELSEAKYAIVQAKEELKAFQECADAQQKVFEDTIRGQSKEILEKSKEIREQSIEIEEIRSALKDEELKSSKRLKDIDELKRKNQQSKQALKQEQEGHKNKIKTIQQESKEHVTRVESRFKKFRETASNREKSLKKNIRHLQSYNRENASIRDLKAENQFLTTQINQSWDAVYERMDEDHKQLLAEYEIEIEARKELLVSFDEMKLELDRRNGQLSHIRNKVEPLIRDTECQICLDRMIDAHISPDCLHRFCGGCVKESIRKCKKECPTCRAPISTKRFLRKDEVHDTFVSSKCVIFQCILLMY